MLTVKTLIWLALLLAPSPRPGACDPNCHCWWQVQFILTDDPRDDSPADDVDVGAVASASAHADLMAIRAKGDAIARVSGSPVAQVATTRTCRWRWAQFHEDPCAFCEHHGTESLWTARAGFGVNAKRKWNSSAGAAGAIEILVPDVALACVAQGGFKLTPEGTDEAVVSRNNRGGFSFGWNGMGPGAGIDIGGGTGSSNGSSIAHGSEKVTDKRFYEAYDTGSDQERHRWTVTVNTASTATVTANGSPISKHVGVSSVELSTIGGDDASVGDSTFLYSRMTCVTCKHPRYQRIVQLWVGGDGELQGSWDE